MFSFGDKRGRLSRTPPLTPIQPSPVPPPPDFKSAPAGCGNCHFWREWPRAEASVCKRNPPVSVQVGLTAPMVSADPNVDGQTFGVFQGMYPATQPGDWCGEHKYKEKP